MSGTLRAQFQTRENPNRCHPNAGGLFILVQLLLTIEQTQCFSALPSSLPSIQSSCTNSRHPSQASTTTTTLQAFPPLTDLIHSMNDLPFSQIGKDLFDELDIGSSLSSDVNKVSVPEAATSMVLESMGKDFLVFLAASVIVTPLATALGITPILGYLIAGALLGPNALDVFSNTKADVELGDFGILFLLFSEGLEVSTSRLQKLTNYLPLGLAQITLTAGVLTGSILLGAPEFLERFIPLDGGLINIHNPIEALVLALAGTLSTSAFVFPVLKEKMWEDEKSGEAATSVLLLQDLAVAPLLVLLPFVVGQNPPDYAAIGFLSLKATIGFGSVMYVGSFALRKVFELVANAKSTETFVALCLLVSVGMGAIAKSLGLTDTAGAFAAGILLANTNYRAQVQADILPFKGILLGIFFMDAGSSFDLDLVMSEFPTIVTGAIALILLKACTLFAATKVPRWMEPNRLPETDAVKLSLLLAGGGEFAFVVLALAERLNVLPADLGGLLTAIVLITMAVTPILGEIAGKIAPVDLGTGALDMTNGGNIGNGVDETPLKVASDAIVVCGFGDIGKSLMGALSENVDRLPVLSNKMNNDTVLPVIAAFDTDLSLFGESTKTSKDSLVVYGDSTNPEVIKSCGIDAPSTIFVSFEDHVTVVSATSRLRNAFPETPIFARAQTRSEAQTLKAIGATDVVIEADELPRSAVPLLIGSWALSLAQTSSPEELRSAISNVSGISENEVEDVLTFYQFMDPGKRGLVYPMELAKAIRNSNKEVLSDDEIDEMERWVINTITSPLDVIEFCRVYMKAPEHVQVALKMPA